MSGHSEHSKSSPLGTYFAVWAALLVGTFLTYEAAKLDLGQFNAAVALIIATTKALLVALFFMHLRGASEKLLKLVVISTIFFLFIMLILSMADFGTRALG
jgi:cytochrome c oxidase subunit IV